VGLGNPGTRYENTRHNIGFRILQDEIAATLKLKFKKNSWNGLSASYEVGEEAVHFLMPQTYMNLSGNAVLPYVKRWDIPLSHILVVHDELDLPFGELRFRTSGSSGGHQGVRSIMECFGIKDTYGKPWASGDNIAALKSAMGLVDNFHRLRIGIGRSREGKNSADHVLETFSKEEAAKLPRILEHAEQAVLHWVTKGPEKTRDFLSSI